MSTWLGINFEPLLSLLARPDVAYVLLVLGIVGILVEIATPGFGVPGITGALAILASVVGLLRLPTNPGGLLFILLAVVLFVVDLKASTHGVLTAAALVSFVIGSVILFPPWQAAEPVPVRLSPFTIAGMTLLLAALFGVALALGLRAQRRPAIMGSDALLGVHGSAVTDLSPKGQVRIAGEQWSATAVDGTIAAGEQVEVTGQQGLTLTVRKAPSGQS